MTRTAPPAHVLEGFGAVGVPRPLAGGRGTAWSVGDLVLKPADMSPGELEWLQAHAGLLRAAPDLRVSVPLESRSGGLVVDGWIASALLPGEHRPGMWLRIADVARRFSALCSGVPRPVFVDERADPWARADRIAWGDEPSADVGLVPVVGELLGLRRAVPDAPTVVHTDLTGNVLFDEAGRPSVIDPTLYWRPVRYAIAIVAVDAVCFEGAPLRLLHEIEPSEGFEQHLLRALVFRMATDVLLGGGEADLGVYESALAVTADACARN